MRTLLAFLLSAVSAFAAPALPGRGFVQEYDSVVQALATSPQQISTTYEIKGLFAINDGEGGSFHYYAGDTTATNATDCFAWGSGRLRRYFLGVTASRVNVFGSSTNNADNLNLDTYLRLGYVVPSLGAGTVAVFDANGVLTNGTASGFITAGDGISVTGSTVATDLLGAGSVTLSTNGSGTITITGAAAASSDNPTASIGLTAVNGVAATFMRSDAAPALGAVGTPGTYGDANNFPVITTDAGGRVTSVTTNPVDPIVNPTDLYLPVRDTATTFINSPLHTPSSASTNTIADGHFRLLGQVSGPNGEAASPTYSFTSSTNSGYYHSSGIHQWSEAGNLFMRAYYNSSPYVGAAVLNLGAGALAFGSGPTVLDTYFGRDAADITAQQRGTNWQTLRLYGTTNASGWSRMSIRHHNDIIEFDSEASGTSSVVPFVFTNAVVHIHKNVGAILSAGDATFVDLNYGAQTNTVSGAISIDHATNGVAGLELTHIRTFYNGSGSDQALTIPSGWRTNVFSAVPAALTNGFVTKMYVRSMGATSTAALQTNVFISFEIY